MPDPAVRRVLLAIDASASVATVAVLADGVVLAQDAAPMRDPAADRLLPLVAATVRAAGLSPRDLTGVACGEGPGSFTSLRIAAATAKGIARGGKPELPLFALPSLALVAAAAPPAPGTTWLVAMDARRGQHYVQPLLEDAHGRVMPAAPVTLAPTQDLAAAAAGRAARLLAVDAAAGVLPHARGASRLARGAMLEVPSATWEPHYGRVAEAQARWEAQHGRPLAAAARGGAA
jgi:tRNA threonylcarbamoyladenosine biosynthesis protein TsaB